MIGGVELLACGQLLRRFRCDEGGREMLARVATAPAMAAVTATAVSRPIVGLRRAIQMPQGDERHQEKRKMPELYGQMQITTHCRGVSCVCASNIILLQPLLVRESVG